MIYTFEWEEEFLPDGAQVLRKYFSNNKLAVSIYYPSKDYHNFSCSTYFEANAPIKIEAPPSISQQTSLQAAKDEIETIFKSYNIKELPSHYKTLL
jgi:hypothetical protein